MKRRSVVEVEAVTPATHIRTSEVKMKMHRFLGGVVFATALATATVGITTRPASAEVRNVCADFNNKLTLNSNLADAFYDLARVYGNLGWSAQSKLASTSAKGYSNVANAYAEGLDAAGCP